MKTLIFIISFILLLACKNNHTESRSSKHSTTKDSVIVIKNDNLFYAHNDWQEGFGLTHDPEMDSIWGKPVKFYIDNPKCSPIAIDFYMGKFRPTDNDSTETLLALVTTEDNQLRPFYRWCLNKTILIQDGALAEYTGVPAREYAEKFPKEFFQYMDYDTTGNRYQDWKSAIAYSGFYDEDDYKKPQDIRKRLSLKMKRNCTNCNMQLIERIEKFAEACFPKSN